MGMINVEIPEKPKVSLEQLVNQQLESDVSWQQFTENTTCHGVKYIFQDSPLKLRRPIWLTMVVFCIGFFISQVGVRTRVYFEYQTTTSSEVFYPRSLEFPAVTICNQNSFRITAAYERNLDDVIEEIFKTNNVSGIDVEMFEDRVKDVNYTDFIITAAHQKQNFIDSCTWNGMACDIETDFKTVITDLGVCYMFNGDTKAPRHTTESGEGAGLKLLLNLEQYEYMRGPNNDAGIKILLHPPEETPVMREHGFAAAPGSRTLVAMKRYEVLSLEPPYGDCHPNNLPVSQCLMECRARAVIDKCGCQAAHMNVTPQTTTDGNTTRYCGFMESVICIREAQNHIKKVGLDCQCSAPCKEVKYDQQLSYAQLSKFNIDRIILDNPKKKVMLEDQFRSVRDVSQRISDASRNWTNIRQFLKFFHEFTETLNDLNIFMGRPGAMPELHNLPDIFSYKFTNSDGNFIIDQYEIANHKAKSFDQTIMKQMKLCLIDIRNNLFNAYSKDDYDIPPFLRRCADMADNAQQNASLGFNSTEKGNLTLRFTEEDEMTCRDEVKQRQFEAMSLVLDVRETLRGLKHFRQSCYEEMVTSIFENSLIKLRDPRHWRCMEVMNAMPVIKGLFADLSNGIDDFIKSDTFQDNLKCIEKVLVNLGRLLNYILSSKPCKWVKDDLVKEYQTDNSFSSLVGLTDQSRELVRKEIHTLTDNLLDIRMTCNRDILPLIQELQSYIDGNGTTSSLAGIMVTPEMVSTIEKMETDFMTLHYRITNIQTYLVQYRNRIATLYEALLELPIPIMTCDSIHQLSLVSEMVATKYANINPKVLRCSEAYTDLMILLDKVIQDYDDIFERMLTELKSPLRQLTNHMSDLKVELDNYQDSLVIDVPFFMENFLQLDVFYKDRYYDVMSEQAVFSLSSLYSEVGGFMGLLLGASVLTLCELLDYILLRLIHHCYKSNQHGKVHQVSVSPYSAPA